jgi:NTE family protein
MTAPPPARVALCLAGGGVTGAMYQIGALAALEDVIGGLGASSFDVYVGVSSGASVAAALAGGASVQRLYRTFLDPADDYFPLQRSHLLAMDTAEWRRTALRVWGALRHGSSALLSRAPRSPDDLWEQVDRVYDSLPAGLFSLDAYEALLDEFFLRRGLAATFKAMPRPLRIPAYDLDSGERVVFGSKGWDDVAVSRACTASMALPLFYSPVQVGGRHYIDGSVVTVAHLDVALAEGADLVVVINPMVPYATDGGGSVPTGHGRRGSLREKGALWIYSQAIRIGATQRLQDRLALLDEATRERVLVLSPRSTDTTLFLHNPASFANRRTMLEYAYRSTKERAAAWLGARPDLAARAGWKLRGQP